MANYRGHVAGSTVFFLLYFTTLAFIFAVDQAYQQFSPVELIVYVLLMYALCLMFGLWPDVDTHSRAQNIFYTIFFIADLVLILTQHFQEAAYLGLFAILPGLGKHRGWTHSRWAMILLPLPLLILPYLFMPSRPLFGLPFYGAAVVGYFSHLFMDGLIFRFRRKRRRATR